MALLEHVFLGSNNTNRLVISENEVPITFVDNTTTKIEVYLGSILVSTDTGEVSFDNAGVVTLDLGAVVGLIANEKYPVILKVYDGFHADGQVLIHPQMDASNVHVKPLLSEII
jgi:hypothetical protein